MPDNVKFCRDGNLHHWNVKRNFSGAALWWNHKSSWQSIVKDMGQLVPFRASEGILAQKMVTLAATIALLQMMSILPTMGLCRTCKVPTPKWKEENWIFWECGSCPSASGKKRITPTIFCFIKILWKDDRNICYENTDIFKIWLPPNLSTMIPVLTHKPNHHPPIETSNTPTPVWLNTALFSYLNFFP